MGTVACAGETRWDTLVGKRRVWGVWGSDGGSMDHVLGQGGALERPG